MRKLLARYGGLLVGALVLVVAGVAAWQAWSYYQAQQTARIAGQFLAAMQVADGPDKSEAARKAALADFEKIVATGTAGYRTLAELRVAALQRDSGNAAAALAALDHVAADAAADTLLRGLASLEWCMMQLESGDPAALAARLAPLAALGNPWHALAQEQQALLDLRLKKTDAARALFKALAQDTTAPDGVRGRANGLLAQLGGP
ncbi:MAG: tetratricopeptide repeat protein [Rhodospirillales bacterium]|nr:tetratricopeptide repeat protein [Rhodospirillales bacterium]MDE2199097.1 tetratricopeptide repeat protein [Rhodospirillales bacterium]MDE2575598.1 tetratricopeptide repeat protein [Rhodospirillales bacterium]